jgi:hypothetical protein
MWTIGILSTITQFLKPAPYFFSDSAMALIYFAPVIGAILAQLWGHWFNDVLMRRSLRTTDGKVSNKPEIRLLGVFIPWVITFAGLVLFGEVLQHRLPWPVLAVAWGANTFGCVASIVPVEAYLLDVFPTDAVLAAAWISFFRTVGGFCVVYFQLKWIAFNGPAIVFGSQAAIVAGVIVFICLTLVYGERWRERYPPPEARH